MDFVKLTLGYGFVSQFQYVIQALLILLKPCGIVYYKLAFDREIHLRTLRIIGEECISSGECVDRGNKCVPCGYFIGRKVFGFIDMDPGSMIRDISIVMITTPTYYSYLTEQPEEFEESPVAEEDIAKKEDCTTISVYNRSGKFEDLSYLRVRIKVNELSPLETQIPIVNQIVKAFKKKQVVRVFIEGVSGSGKSSIGYCVAKTLHGKFTHSFNPTDPGDTFGQLISIMNYENPDDPNIIVLEEVDTLLDRIHYGKVTQNPKISTMIKDKTNWNSFLDDLVFYKNTILILTSNTPKSEMDKLDPAYLRKGRIDLYFQMNTPVPL